MSFFLLVFGAVLVFFATAPLVWRLMKPDGRARATISATDRTAAAIRHVDALEESGENSGRDAR